MPLVHVVHGRGDLHRVQRVHASDAEHNLLFDPHLQISAVQLCGDEPVLLGVFGNIGVEQVENDPTNLQGPDLRAHGALQDFHLHKEGLPVGIQRFGQRQMAEVLVQLHAVLPAFLVDLLAEIAVPIQEAECDERHVQVACRLAMVPGKNP